MALLKVLQDRIWEELADLESACIHPENYLKINSQKAAHYHQSYECGNGGKPLTPEQMLSAALLFIQELKEYELGLIKRLQTELHFRSQKAANPNDGKKE